MHIASSITLKTIHCTPQDERHRWHRDDINDQDSNTAYGDIRVTPLNGEKYLSFQVGNLCFIDSFQFLSTKLENLMSLLLWSGRDKFAHTIKYLEVSDLVFAKGVYPYSYRSRGIQEKFGETQLPPIEAFYNTLDDEALTQEDYERAKKIWAHYKMNILENYHDHYPLSDVLLLPTSFKISATQFTKNITKTRSTLLLFRHWHGSQPWSTWMPIWISSPTQTCNLMIENNMWGSIATISHWHARANNPLVEGYNWSQPNSYITYLDANNLCWTAMSEPLPVGNFLFLFQAEIANFDLMNIPAHSDTGTSSSAISNAPKIYTTFIAYPLASEHLAVSSDTLSEFCNQIKGQNSICSKKLIPDLLDKTKYTCHYWNLQFYIKHGLILT